MPKSLVRPTLVALTCLIIGAAAGLWFSSQSFTPPPFQFSDEQAAIHIAGSWQSANSQAPNSVDILCQLAAGVCEVAVAVLTPGIVHHTISVTDALFPIKATSDQKLTAISKTFDGCHTQIISIDRKNQTATLTIAPTNSPNCLSMISTSTALLSAI